MANQLPLQPIYLNQKEAAQYLRVHETFLKKAADDGLIIRCKRKGAGFVYKIKELIELANDIDNGELPVT